jgi:hypothetical protein
MEKIGSRCSRDALPFRHSPSNAAEAPEQFTFLISCRLELDGHQPDGGTAVTREHDILPRFGATDEVGEVSLGKGDGDIHVGKLDQGLVHLKSTRAN